MRFKVTNGAITVDSYFRPCDATNLNAADWDLGSTSPLLLDPATFTGFYSGLSASLNQSEWGLGLGLGLGCGVGVRVRDGIRVGVRVTGGVGVEGWVRG